MYRQTFDVVWLVVGAWWMSTRDRVLFTHAEYNVYRRTRTVYSVHTLSLDDFGCFLLDYPAGVEYCRRRVELHRFRDIRVVDGDT